MNLQQPRQKTIRIVALLILGLGLYGLVPRLHGFQAAWHLGLQADPAYFALATVMSLLTFFAAAGMYRVLAFSRLAYGQTVLVQLAAAFVNRLLPSGIGGMGANVAYLHTQKHRVTQAVTVATINNLIGFVAHLSLLFLFLLALPIKHTGSIGLRPPLVYWVAASGVILITLFVIGSRLPKIHKLWQQVVRDLRSFKNRPRALVKAFTLAAILTSCNVLCLVFICQAVGVTLSLTSAFIVLTGGVGAGTIVPTPGGLGGFEAGLYAAMLTQNIAPAPAVASVLLFRLVTFWLPLALGGVAFVYCQRRRLFGFSL